MSTPYSSAAPRGTDAALASTTRTTSATLAPTTRGATTASASAALAFLPRAARHQLWHLNNSWRRALLSLLLLAAPLGHLPQPGPAPVATAAAGE